MKQIFKLNGQYLGYISKENIFSRDNIYLGWLEGQNVWDTGGAYRGRLLEIAGHNYILKNRFEINPLPRPPRVVPTSPSAPAPLSTIAPILAPLGFQDGF